MITEERLRLYPRALLFAVVTAWLVTLATGEIGGDFAAFHAAGTLVAEGRSADLYSWEAQQAAQAARFDEPGTFLPFPYPPFVALAYVPFSWLDYRLAFALHTLGMGVALAGAVALLRPLLAVVDRRPLACFVGLLCFYPMFRAVTGAQNTALTLLIVVGCWRALDAGRPVLAGAVAALLLYKPQLGLPLLGLLALYRPPTLAGAAPVAGALFASGAVVGGWRWVPWWWEQIGRFHEADRVVSAADAVGLLGFTEALLGHHALARGVGAVLTMAVIVALIALWARPGRTLGERFAITAPALVLIPPHALFYDVGLSGLTLLVLADRWGTARAGTLALLYLGALLALLAPVLGVNPLVGWVVLVCWLTLSVRAGP